MAPSKALGLDIVGNCLLDGTRLAGLSNGERTSVSRQEGSGNAGQDNAGQDSHGQRVLLDLFSTRRLRGAKDYTLDLVVDATAGLEGIGCGIAGEVA